MPAWYVEGVDHSQRSPGPVAQLVEHLTFNQRVAGSSPARLTSLTIVFSIP